jgi:magnesium-transporting ATPase (P-type)
LPELGLAILAVVLINGVFAFAQEYRAERAAEHLNEMVPRRATVVRDGLRVEIEASELVVGDLVVVSSGDRVPADLRLVEEHSLALDTSLLTGESALVRPTRDEEAPAGTFVVEGEGRGIVERTGSRTRLGAIASLARAGRRPPTPLALELQRLVRRLSLIAVTVGGVFFLVALPLGFGATDGFLFAVGVTVALVPEGLLPTVTLSLAVGAQRMARQNALLRRLESVETLGSATFICTDKTGTLTENQMSVVEIWTPQGSIPVESRGYDPGLNLTIDVQLLPAARQLAATGVLSSAGRVLFRGGEWLPQGDPMEVALDVVARRLGCDTSRLEAEHPISRRFPFDPARRIMSVLAGEDLHVKGAPEAILARTGTGNESALAALHLMTTQGLRVLAFATRTIPVQLHNAPRGELERELVLLGLVGFEDLPRPDARPALEKCREAGIRVAMVTGDHPATALAVGREVGLFQEDGLQIDGTNLPSDEQALAELLDRDGVIVSRVSPEDKLRIAKALRSKGHVVAMTGDGVNDGPALQEANIGIAMGRSGTDVAREAADLVLLDDNFSTIVAAIEEGRSVFRNIRRFLTYHLTDNVAELTPFVVWALSGGNIPLALGVMQILALDLGTDLLPALALGAEKPTPASLQQPPRRLHLIDRALLTRVFGVLGPVEAVVEMLAFFAVFLAAGWRPGEAFPGGDLLLQASGAAFTAVVIGQMANVFACRSSTQFAWRVGWRSNPFVVFAIAAEIAALAVFLLVPPVADLLDHAVPGVEGFVVALLAFPAVLLGDWLYKLATRPAQSADQEDPERTAPGP